MTLVLETLGQGCAGPDRRTRIKGEVFGRNHVVHESIVVDAEDLVLDSLSSGSPCRRVLEARGVFHLSAGSVGSNERVDSLRLTFLSRDEVSLVHAEGQLTTGCLGPFSFATVEPLALRHDRECPVGGLIEVEIGGQTERVRATAEVYLGQLEYDFDLDGEVDSILGGCAARWRDACRES